MGDSRAGVKGSRSSGGVASTSAVSMGTPTDGTPTYVSIGQNANNDEKALPRNSPGGYRKIL